MKKLFFALVLFSLSIGVNAQFLNYGVKGGINYNTNGDLSLSSGDINDVFSSNEEIGYHFGVLAEIKLPLFLYLRPEIVYTHTESSYNGNGEESKLKMDKIDVPILLGFRVLGFGRFFFGPNFQYVINENLTAPEALESISTLSYDDFIVAGQIGLGVNFGKFGADVRWETGLSNSQANYIVDGLGIENSPEIQVDTDPQQFILSFYYKIK